MKAVSKLVVLISVSVLGLVAASAATSEQAYLQACRKDPGIPVPIAVVSPAVSSEYSGSTVQLEFTVDRTGKPKDLSVKSATDEKLGAAVLDAVKQWKFKPAERNGEPVATRVALPVKIVDPTLPGSIFAAN